MEMIQLHTRIGAGLMLHSFNLDHIARYTYNEAKTAKSPRDMFHIDIELVSGAKYALEVPVSDYAELATLANRANDDALIATLAAWHERVAPHEKKPKRKSKKAPV